MKIKAFAALVKQTKMLHIYNVIDSEGTVTQWASNGNAAYPLHGLPFVDPPQLLRMLDIPEKDNQAYAAISTDDFEIEASLRKKFDEFWESESEGTELSDSELLIEWMDGPMIMLYDHRTEDVYPISTKYLNPLGKSDDRPAYFYRDGTIAIKQGLLLTALVGPISLKRAEKMTESLILLGNRICKYQKEDEANAEQNLPAV